MAGKYTEENTQPSMMSDKYKKINQSVLIRSTGNLPGGTIKCRIRGIAGRTHLVEIISDDPKAEPQYLECVKAGRIISKNKNSSMTSVGDIVAVMPGKKKKGKITTPKIMMIAPRQTTLSRTSIKTEKREHVIASNIDKLIILAAAASPRYNKKLLDRFLVSAELNGIEPIICINKIDLEEIEYLKEDLAVYSHLGIKIYFISATENIGVDEFRKSIEGYSSVLSGPSGVGKSTLLNQLLGDEVQAVSEISDRTDKGRHTTSAVRMFDLQDGISTIIDTPGIREFGVWGLSQEELHLYFHEFDEFNEHCKYSACTHTHEPFCAVKEAFIEELINDERYESYLNLYDTLPDLRIKS